VAIATFKIRLLVLLYLGGFNMNIGIIGKGFVGTAVFEGMKHAVEVLAYDKAKGWFSSWERPQTDHGAFSGLDPAKWQNDMYYCGPLDHISDEKERQDPGKSDIYYLMKNTTGPVLVCVPTPMKGDGLCDLSIVESVIAEANAAVLEYQEWYKKELSEEPKFPPRVLVIKSTVPPGTTERFNAKYENVIVCFNPEFLTERTAIDDFKNQDRIILGGPREGTAVLKQLYQKTYPDVPTTKTSSTIAEMIKYVTNCFLATKVSFANEIRQICDGLQIDYDKVIEYATKDKRLGLSHWAVPGHDGHHGFGGSCFPKDLNALRSLASVGLGVDTKVLDAVWAKNLEVRPEKDWEQLKGRAVSEE
jgi:UDPglucose 6-dehydrogenase